jgi:hypothetical protein
VSTGLRSAGRDGKSEESDDEDDGNEEECEWPFSNAVFRTVEQRKAGCMETYRILLCMLPPRNSLRSPLTSLRSPHMLGFWVVCLPYAPQQQLITHISPHMERTRGIISPCTF